MKIYSKINLGLGQSKYFIHLGLILKKDGLRPYYELKFYILILFTTRLYNINLITIHFKNE